MHRSFNIDEHLTKQHWQPVFLFSKPSVSFHVSFSYIELSLSKLHKTGDLQVGNWHVYCQHSSISFVLLQFYKILNNDDEPVYCLEYGKQLEMSVAYAEFNTEGMKKGTNILIERG